MNLRNSSVLTALGLCLLAGCWSHEPESGIRAQALVAADASWTATTPLPKPLSDTCVAVAAGRVYVLGGFDPTASTSNHATAATWVADIRSDGTLGPWTASVPLPEERLGLSCFTDEFSDPALINIVGGAVGDGGLAASDCVLGADSGSWNCGAPRLTVRPAGTATARVHGAPGDMVDYVIAGGFLADGGVTAGVLHDQTPGIYELEFLTLPQAIGGAAAATLADNTMLVLGGASASGPQAFIESVSIPPYSQTLDPFVDGGTLPSAVEFATAATIGDTVYVVGGDDGGTPRPDVVAGVATGRSIASWSPFTPLPAPRTRASSFTYNGHLVVVGGADSTGPVADVFSLAVDPIAQAPQVSTMATPVADQAIWGGALYELYMLGATARVSLTQPPSRTLVTPLPSSALQGGGALVFAAGRAVGGRQFIFVANATDVWSAEVLADGSLRPWINAGPLQISSFYDDGIAVSHGSLYVMRGGTQDIRSVVLRPDGTFDPARWRNFPVPYTTVSPSPRYQFDGDFIYEQSHVGLMTPSTGEELLRAPVASDGALGTFTHLGDFPFNSQLRVHEGRVFEWRGPANDLLATPIRGDGTLGLWARIAPPGQVTDSLFFQHGSLVSVNWSGGPTWSLAILSIADGPVRATGLSFSAPGPTYQALAGIPFDVDLRVTDDYGKIVDASAASISLSAPGATLGGPTSADAQSGIVHFTGISISQTGTFDIHAQSAGLAEAIATVTVSTPAGGAPTSTDDRHSISGWSCSSGGGGAGALFALGIFVLLLRRRRGAAAALLLFAATATRAASPPAGAGVDMQSVRDLNRQGLEALEAHRYEDAIRAFEGARAKYDSTVILYNLAEAHRRAGHPDQALDLYHQYLQRVPDPSKRADVRALAALEKAAAAPVPSPAPPPPRVADAVPAPHVPAAKRLSAPVEEGPSRGWFHPGLYLGGAWDPSSHRISGEALAQFGIGDHWMVLAGPQIGPRIGARLMIENRFYDDEDFSVALAVRGLLTSYSSAWSGGGGGGIDLGVHLTSWLDARAAVSAEQYHTAVGAFFAPVVTFGLGSR